MVPGDASRQSTFGLYGQGTVEQGQEVEPGLACQFLLGPCMRGNRSSHLGRFAPSCFGQPVGPSPQVLGIGKAFDQAQGFQRSQPRGHKLMRLTVRPRYFGKARRTMHQKIEQGRMRLDRRHEPDFVSEALRLGADSVDEPLCHVGNEPWSKVTEKSK